MNAARILVVEDDQIIALDISQTVRSFGYDVIGVANTGPEALRIAEAQKPDLALMDISLGGSMDGIAAARQIRSHWSIPVIFLTAHADIETLARASINGAFAHLTKPIRVEELRAAISIALRQHNALHELLESNEWLSALLGSITEGVLAIDCDGRVIYLNPQAESLTGWYSSDAYGKPVEDIFQLASLQGRPVAGLRIKTAANTHAGMPRERFLLRRREGQEVPIEETIAPLWSGGRFLGALSVFRDLSEALKFEQAQKWETVGVLAAGVAHDFNNLLAVIIGNTQLAMESVPADSKEREFLQDAFNAGQRASELTSQLLAYAGKSSWRRQVVDFGDTVRGFSDLLKAVVPDNIALSISLPAGLPTIEADPKQIQQIAMNLVINAAEAIGTDSGSIGVFATAAKEYEGLFFSVRDTGLGMDAETRAKIFDPFFSTKFLGRGLGLAAVQGIVRSHEGAIDVDTMPGKGSTFTVFFPASEARLREDEKEKPAAAPLGSETVLVVDDSDAVAKFVKASLEHFGFSVVVTNSGRSALDILASGVPAIDLVLLDLSMPDLSGSETARIIRQRFPATPICFMSGYNETVMGVEASSERFDRCFLHKPFTPDQLVAKMRTILRTNPKEQKRAMNAG